MKAPVLLLLALLASTAHAGNWSSWWLTPDQEGQRALKDGDPSRAARLFTDPQRRAYAQIEAKQYTDAASSLAPLTDAESQYNRGNALARAGDLTSALTAYDTALKRAPADSSLRRDAQHNRDLVAKQLKSQDKQQQNGAGQDGKGGQQDQKSGQQDQKSGQQDQKSGRQDQKSGQQDEKAGQQDQKSGQQDQKAGQQGGADGQQNELSNQQQGAGQQDQKNNPSKAGGAPDSADQARRDAEAALNHSRDQNPQGTEQPSQLSQAQNRAGDDDSRAARGSTPSGSKQQPSAPRTSPPSEQSLSTDQWLRQIPDDPAGLLRRKFLIEHMMKQGTQP